MLRNRVSVLLFYQEKKKSHIKFWFCIKKNLCMSINSTNNKFRFIHQKTDLKFLNILLKDSSFCRTWFLSYPTVNIHNMFTSSGWVIINTTKFHKRDLCFLHQIADLNLLKLKSKCQVLTVFSYLVIPPKILMISLHFFIELLLIQWNIRQRHTWCIIRWSQKN